MRAWGGELSDSESFQRYCAQGISRASVSAQNADWAPRDLWLTRCARGLLGGGCWCDIEWLGER